MSIVTFHRKSYAVWHGIKFRQISTEKCNSYVTGITLQRTVVKCSLDEQSVFALRQWTKHANALWGKCRIRGGSSERCKSLAIHCRGLKNRIDIQIAENNAVGRDSGHSRYLREQTATRLAFAHSCACCCLQPATLSLLVALQPLCDTDMITRVPVVANTPTV